MTVVHVHAPQGHYLGQVKRLWARQWRTVTKDLTDPKTAMAIAVLKMEKDDSRARVIFCTEWYDPTVVMECTR